MRGMNKWYDRMSAATRLKTRAEREQEFDKIDKELAALRKETEGVANLTKLRTAVASSGRTLVLFVAPDNLWIELKRYGAPNVRNIELSRIRDIQSVRVEGPVVRHGALIVSALSMLLESEQIFDFGTSEGETSWLLAHNHPKVRIYAFDGESSSPAGGRRRFDDTIEASRITELRGDSADPCMLLRAQTIWPHFPGYALCDLVWSFFLWPICSPARRLH